MIDYNQFKTQYGTWSSNDQAIKWLLSIINHEVAINILIKANS